MMFDKEDLYQQIIMGACASLITERGFTPRQVLELLDELPSQIWTALNEISKEEK